MEENDLRFDTIDGLIVCKKRFDSNDNSEFYDCYLLKEDGEEGHFIGEAYSNDIDEIKAEVNSLLQ